MQIENGIAIDSNTSARIGGRWFYLFDIEAEYRHELARQERNRAVYGWALPAYVADLDAYKAHNARCGGKEVMLLEHAVVIADDGMNPIQRFKSQGRRIVSFVNGDLVKVQGKLYSVVTFADGSADLQAVASR